MSKEKHEKQAGRAGNGWVSCGIGSGNGKNVIWVCEKCGWQAEISAWKPAACPRCGLSFAKYHE